MLRGGESVLLEGRTHSFARVQSATKVSSSPALLFLGRDVTVRSCMNHTLLSWTDHADIMLKSAFVSFCCKLYMSASVCVRRCAEALNHTRPLVDSTRISSVPGSCPPGGRRWTGTAEAAGGHLSSSPSWKSPSIASPANKTRHNCQRCCFHVRPPQVLRVPTWRHDVRCDAQSVKFSCVPPCHLSSSSPHPLGMASQPTLLAFSSSSNLGFFILHFPCTLH